MDPIISVNRLTKKYGERIAVNDISFRLYPGQVLGLLGPNGAGKTTTMRMLMGLSKPSSGSVTVFGHDTRTHAKLIHSRIGVVFERSNLFENLSAYQNLALFCRLYDTPLSAIQPLLERMDLWSRVQDPVKSFSKGMKQRLLICRALIHRPPLLFLDEPASGLDPVSSKIIWDYLKEQITGGTTIVLTSHDMTEVEELCDMIGFMNQGHLITFEKTNILKARFGQPTIRVTFQSDQGMAVETLEPTLQNLQRIQSLYAEKRVINLRSMEASLTEIFQKLCENGIPPQTEVRSQEPSDRR